MIHKLTDSPVHNTVTSWIVSTIDALDCGVFVCRKNEFVLREDKFKPLCFYFYVVFL